MTSKNICALVAPLALFAGCYTIEPHETTYPIAVTPVRMGPGGAEGDLVECAGLRQDSYSGEKIAIGLFPGYSYFVEGLGVGTAGGTFVYATWVPIGNLFFALPTICTLLVEPFVQTNSRRKANDCEILSVGLVGAFRWKSSPSIETEEKYRERALVAGGRKTDFACGPRSVSRDGTTVYFDYPGFHELKSVVEEAGRVDVVFADGSRIRRFVPSDHDDSRLTYEDRVIETEPTISVQFARVYGWKSLLLCAKRLRYAKGFATADAELRGEIDAFESDAERIAGNLDEQARADLAVWRERCRALANRLER